MTSANGLARGRSAWENRGAVNGPSALILGGLSEPGPNPTRCYRDEAPVEYAPPPFFCHQAPA